MYLKGLCQLENMRAEVMQITSTVKILLFLTRDFLCQIQGSQIYRDLYKRTGYAGLSFLNFFVMNKSVKIITCSFEVKMYPIHKNRVQTNIQQQHIVVVN